MGLTKNWKFKGLEIEDAYIIVSKVQIAKLVKDVNQPYGVAGWNAGAHNCFIEFFVYASKEARDSGENPIESGNCTYNCKTTESSKNHIAQAYDHIKENHKLLLDSEDI